MGDGDRVPDMVRRLFSHQSMYGSDPGGAEWDEIEVVCVRVEDLPTPRVPSIQMQCASCEQLVWIRHGMVEDIAALHRQEFTIHCIQCAIARLDEEGGGEYNEIREI